MLKAAIDESGTHHPSDHVCVAACLGTSTQWRHLFNEWRPIASHFVPRGKHFHAAKASDDLNEALARLLARRMEKIVAVVVNRADFKAIASDRFKSNFGAEYAVGVQMCLTQLGHWSYNRARQPIAYVLESGHKSQNAVSQILAGSVRTRETRRQLLIQSFSWRGKGEPMLDGPDMVSHVVWSEAQHGQGCPALDVLKAVAEIVVIESQMLNTIVREIRASWKDEIVNPFVV